MTDTDHRSIGSARANLGQVVRNAATRRRRTVITAGQDSAVVMSIDEVHDLEDAAVYAQWRSAGSPTIGTLDHSANELGFVIPETHERAA
jgi:hypothetical protein